MAHDELTSALTALDGLLDEFRRGQIVTRSAERSGMERHTGALTARWDDRFPGFPAQYFPYTSFRGEHYRGRRDAHLRDVIVQVLDERDGAETTIVNPACVFGRHACDLASRLASSKVIGTDIDRKWSRIYHRVRGRRIPANYSFVKDNVFDSRLDVDPTAVVFFGACGSVSDGAIDLAVGSNAPHLMFRTCCHDNIGGNVEITKRFNPINWFFKYKNWAFDRMRQRASYAGFYFSDRYVRTSYPRSEAVRGVSTPEEFRAVARQSAHSDICRTIIDLDRYAYLVEKGYSVLYQGELFVATREAS